jgi:hypothetical protein
MGLGFSTLLYSQPWGFRGYWEITLDTFGSVFSSMSDFYNRNMGSSAPTTNFPLTNGAFVSTKSLTTDGKIVFKDTNGATYSSIALFLSLAGGNIDTGVPPSGQMLTSFQVDKDINGVSSISNVAYGAIPTRVASSNIFGYTGFVTNPNSGICGLIGAEGSVSLFGTQETLTKVMFEPGFLLTGMSIVRSGGNSNVTLRVENLNYTGNGTAATSYTPFGTTTSVKPALQVSGTVAKTTYSSSQINCIPLDSTFNFDADEGKVMNSLVSYWLSQPLPGTVSNVTIRDWVVESCGQSTGAPNVITARKLAVTSETKDYFTGFMNLNGSIGALTATAPTTPLKFDSSLDVTTYTKSLFTPGYVLYGITYNRVASGVATTDGVTGTFMNTTTAPSSTPKGSSMLVLSTKNKAGTLQHWKFLRAEQNALPYTFQYSSASTSQITEITVNNFLTSDWIISGAKETVIATYPSAGFSLTDITDMWTHLNPIVQYSILGGILLLFLYFLYWIFG